MKQFQIQACVLFDRPYDQEELFDEPLPPAEDEDEDLSDEPLIGFYTTRYVSAQSVAEAVHYVEEELTTDDELPPSRIYDMTCTEVQFADLSREVREGTGTRDVPGIWYDEGLGFFSEIEIEKPHTHDDP